MLSPDSYRRKHKAWCAKDTFSFKLLADPAQPFANTIPWDKVQVCNIERLRGFQVDDYQVVMRGRVKR